MNEVFFVRVNLPKLRETLNAPACIELTNDDLFDWLLDHGFRIGMQGWYADSAGINHLDPKVIESCERVSPNVTRR